MDLCVNIDHIATLREARGGIDPDPVHAAVIAELAGVSGIVCHLREDRRHINDRDVRLLRDVVTTKLDLEMAATEEIIAFALDVIPDLVTIVPERRQELTTEGGLDVAGNLHFFGDIVKIMHDKGIGVSFFVDPVPSQVDAVLKTGAGIIELHTGSYASARSRTERDAELTKIHLMAELADEAGLFVTVGHGLTLRNVAGIRDIGVIREVSIGHSIISRAAFVGLNTAVSEMISALKGAGIG